MSKKTAITHILIAILAILSALIVFAGCSENEKESEVTPAPTEEPMPEDFVDKDSEYYTEIYRQQLHYSPEKGWINDPNGLVYFNGEYHLFYQYCPDNPGGGWMCWGHAVSTDLIHWEELGVAIPSTSNTQIWSGSCIVDENNVTGFFNETGSGLVAFYTRLSSSGQEQCIAYSADGREWTKYNNGRPVISSKDDPLKITDGFRDPKVILTDDGETWIMVVAGNALRIYSSKDLINWNFERSYEKEQTIDGVSVPAIITECPDLIKIKVEGKDEYKWMLNLGGTQYMVGDFKQVDGVWSYIPETGFITLNYGPDAYASQTFYNAPNGRIIMVSWMSNPGNGSLQLTWTPEQCGSMNILTELTLKETESGYIISQKPIEEMDGLLMNYTKEASSDKSTENILSDFNDETNKNDMYKLEILVKNGNFTASLFGGDVLVKYDTQTGILVFDRSNTGNGGKYEINIPCDEGEAVDFEIYVDVASVEIYAKGGLYTASFVTYGTVKRELSIDFEGYKKGKIYAKATKLNSIWRDLRWTNVEASPLELLDSSPNTGKENTITLKDARLFANEDVEWEITDGSDIAEIVSSNYISAVVKCKADGDFTIKVSRGEETAEKTYTSADYSFKTNISTWKSVNSAVNPQGEKGLTISSGGDGFYTSTEKCGEEYELSFKLSDEGAVAVGIVLGCRDYDSPTKVTYVINFDLNQKNFRIFKFNNASATDVSAISFKKAGFTVEKGKIYDVKVSYKNGAVTYVIDGVTIFENVEIDADNTYFGIMTYSGMATFREIYIENTGY